MQHDDVDTALSIMTVPISESANPLLWDDFHHGGAGVEGETFGYLRLQRGTRGSFRYLGCCAQWAHLGY